MKKLVISNVIKELGIPASLAGYQYIIYGVELLLDNVDLMNYITEIYCDVAKRFNKTPSQAERNIRHAIETGWERANEDFVNKLFGYSVSADKGKPTNSEFLVTVADYILMTQEN